jgi:hypothetical protein
MCQYQDPFTYEDLEAYYRLDTLAMVRILDAMERLAT